MEVEENRTKMIVLAKGVTLAFRYYDGFILHWKRNINVPSNITDVWIDFEIHDKWW